MNENWKTSSYSNNTQQLCLEARHKGIVQVRDTKSREQGTLAFQEAVWADFLRLVAPGRC